MAQARLAASPTNLRLMSVIGTLVFAMACSVSEPPSDPPVPQPTSEPASVAVSAQAPATPLPDPGDAVLALSRPSGPPPLVDTSIASVPLADVVFDTFRGGFIRLSEASEADSTPPRPHPTDLLI